MIGPPIEPDQDYEVAVMSATISPVKPSRETFSKTAEDSKLEIMKDVITTIQTGKIPSADGGLPGVIRFATSFNLQMEKIARNIRLVPDSGMKSLSMVNDTEDRTVWISKNWADAFGFTQNTFPKGTTEAHTL
jgi:hypothetical protein